MLIKRIFLTLFITGVIAISTTGTQAQSTRGNAWSRNNSINNPVPTVPDPAPERLPAEEMQITSQESRAERKTAIVGSWLGISGEGNRLINSFTSDGIILGSVQTEVSTIPELGVLTPSHGVWTYLSGRQFGVTTVGILYDINTGAYLGYLKARLVLTLNEAGDQMSGTDKVEIFGPDGKLVFAVPVGNTTFTRIKFEPFN